METQQTLELVFGAGGGSITWWQMVLRAVLIFCYGVLLFRFSYRRFFGQSTDFDIVVAILIGSTLSRALTGNAPLIPTLAATAAIVVLHSVLARLAWSWDGIGWLIKGVETRIFEHGRPNETAMRRTGVTERDLLEAIRQRGAEDLSQVETAVLERSGRISVILRRDEKPRRSK